MLQVQKKRNGGNFGLKIERGKMGMNTSEAAKLLGVSASTIQRWIKQLDLPMERNERGHYYFNQEDIILLKNIKDQVQNGVLLQDIAPPQTEKKIRKGTVKTPENDNTYELLAAKVRELELSMNAKADSVASYQLLQHRSEIEELTTQVADLTRQLHLVQEQLTDLMKPMELTDFEVPKDSKRKKKHIFQSWFGTKKPSAF
jgi:chromosome-anchoring protein RacA